MPLGTETRAGVATSGAPQWVAGKQTAGSLVFNAGNIYRVRQDIANGQTAPTASNAFYLKLAYDDTSIYALVNSLGDELHQYTRYTTRWDLEKAVVLDLDSQGSLNYASGNAFAFTPGAYAAGIIQLQAFTYARQGDLIAVRIAAGSRNLVFQSGATEGFGFSGGPKTMPALAGQQYIFHAVIPNPNNTTGSYWVVHSMPSSASATPGTGTAIPFGPLTATGAANETFALPTGTQSVRGVQVLDASPQAGVHPVLGLVSSLYTLNSSASPPTLTVKAPYTLGAGDTIEGIAFTTSSAPVSTAGKGYQSTYTENAPAAGGS